MLLNEPPESSYDLRFSLLGIDVRIAWSFWLAALIFGYTAARNVDELFIDTSSGKLPWLALWCGVMFASILIHEMGHAIAFRRCGVNANVVLYHFGGLAIPTSGRGPGLSSLRLDSYQNIFIAAAGPLAQLLLAVLLLVALRLGGYALIGGEEQELMETGRGIVAGPSFLLAIPGFASGRPVTHPGMFALVDFMLFINIWWPLLNLVPVWPLDGGRISRELIVIGGGSRYVATQVSLVAAGALAFLFFSWGQPFAGFLFISLAVGSYQMLDTMGGWRT
jgi:Zn-dependent protease